MAKLLSPLLVTSLLSVCFCLAVSTCWAEEKIKKKDSAALTDRRGFRDETTVMSFVKVAGGCFRMGDAFGDGESEEKPVHEVCLGDFSIGRYEVTQGLWKNVMGNNPSYFSSCGDDCPVEQVSWNEVQDFIRRLNARTGRRYRLPTEAEWEYAARSGGKSEKFSGGQDVSGVAWYSENSGRKTHPVGGKRANGLGIFDMTGNVWEWVQDLNGGYRAAREQNPTGPSTGSYRVSRGGSWNTDAREARATFRNINAPTNSYYNLGFRLVSPDQCAGTTGCPAGKNFGKPCAGKSHARFDEGGQGRPCSPLYRPAAQVSTSRPLA